MNEPASWLGRTRLREGAPGPGAGDEDRGDTRTVLDTLGTLEATIDHACEELLAAVPFLGDQRTGALVNGYVDDVVGALREVRADADDLRRVIAIAQQRADRPLP